VSNHDARRVTEAPLSKRSAFDVPALQHVLGACVHYYPRFWMALARLETNLLTHDLDSVPLRMPIYICGLARSGSTLLHEIVASHPAVASHRVKDYPLVFTPYWWRRATRGRAPSAPRERAHGDRVLITSDSPDALEEMLWMAFFPRCHDPAATSVLDGRCSHPAFEAAYRAHLRKLMLAERATRYAAKANYHVARLAYLQRLFPDARFIVPVREPVSHIASLMRQQQRFAEGQRRRPRALAAMQWSGHFEFGLDRRPMNLGDTARVRDIQDAWRRDEEALGWALYWAMVHDHLADRLEEDARLRSAALVVRFEALCDAPQATLAALFSHSALAGAGPLIEQSSPRVRRPDYYTRSLTAQDIATIRRETAHAAARWGYA
jgi:hypothetical protein